jgi:predicted glutamine amidotransferase
LTYLSLWYTAGRDYGLHDGEWKMIGGSDGADSILVASEPLTRDTAAWVEVPEYSMLHARLERGRPAVIIDDLE